MPNDKQLAFRMLAGLERLTLENATLKAVLQYYHGQTPWREHLAAVEGDPEVVAAIRDRFSELRAQLQADTDLAMGIQRLLTIFPANKDEN